MKITSVIVVKYPVGEPTLDCFETISGDLPDELTDGQVLVKTQFLSVDPYMRGRINASLKSYTPPYPLNSSPIGGGAGVVVKSKSSRFAEGDVVVASMPWQDYVLLQDSNEMLRKWPLPQLPPSYGLGVIGMPGVTAYCGLLHICEPKAGETVVVSGAAGAVGSIVGQIAKIKGCRVVGIAGSDDKLAWLTSLGFDAVVNYKTSTDIRKSLEDLCPDGVDAYFDNVGGPITDAVLSLMKVNGRIASCGSISSYNKTDADLGPRPWRFVVSRGLKIQGYIVSRDFKDQWSAALKQLGEWVVTGKLKTEETITEGLTNAPRAFIEMLAGKNTGKAIVKL